MRWKEKIASAAEAGERVLALRRAAGKIAFTNGCFDIIHAGHVRLLMYSRSLAGALVVALNSDRSVAALKGPGRPVNLQQDRAEVLAALSCVDLVIIFNESTPLDLLRRLNPDVYVKGGDYLGRDIPEAGYVRSYGGEVFYVPYLEGRSTTAIIERIKETGDCFQVRLRGQETAYRQGSGIGDRRKAD